MVIAGLGPVHETFIWCYGEPTFLRYTCWVDLGADGTGLGFESSVLNVPAVLPVGADPSTLAGASAASSDAHICVIAGQCTAWTRTTGGSASISGPTGREQLHGSPQRPALASRHAIGWRLLGRGRCCYEGADHWNGTGRREAAGPRGTARAGAIQTASVDQGRAEVRDRFRVFRRLDVQRRDGPTSPRTRSAARRSIERSGYRWRP